MEEEPIVLHSAVSDSESNDSQEIMHNDQPKSSQDQFESTSEISQDDISTPSSTFPFNVDSDVNESAKNVNSNADSDSANNVNSNADSDSANNVNSNADSESINSITDITVNDTNTDTSIGESDGLSSVMLHDHCYSPQPHVVPKSSSHAPSVTGVLRIIPLVSLFSDTKQLVADPLSAVSLPVLNINMVSSTGSGNIPSTGFGNIQSTDSGNILSTDIDSGEVSSIGSGNVQSSGSENISAIETGNIPSTDSGNIPPTGSGNIPFTGSESCELPEAISQELFTSNESVPTSQDHETDLHEEEEERMEETEKKEEIQLQSQEMEQAHGISVDDGSMETQQDNAPMGLSLSYAKKPETISDVPPHVVAQHLQTLTDSIDDDEELKKVVKICAAIVNTYFQKE